jgi:Cu/Ag efflux protein CusF
MSLPPSFSFKIMSKVKTYGIHGVVERVIAARLGKATMNITFSGGIMDSSGVRPATFTTNKVVEQYVVENHPMFKNGSIKVISEIDLEPKKETAKTEKVDEVTTLQQARQYLIEKGVSIEKLQNKADIKACAAEMNITFPNW